MRDQFVEYVLDGALRRKLKQFVRRQPTATLLGVRREAICWERKGLPGGVRGRRHSVPAVLGYQFRVNSSPCVTVASPQVSELGEVKEMLRLQQEQLSLHRVFLICRALTSVVLPLQEIWFVDDVNRLVISPGIVMAMVFRHLTSRCLYLVNWQLCHLIPRHHRETSARRSWEP